MKYAEEYLNKIKTALDTLYDMEDENETFYYFQEYRELEHNPENMAEKNILKEIFAPIREELEENDLHIIYFLDIDDIIEASDPLPTFETIREYMEYILDIAKESFNIWEEIGFINRYLIGKELEILENAGIKEEQTLFNKEIFKDEIESIRIEALETFKTTFHQPHYLYFLVIAKNYPLFNDVILISQEQTYNILNKFHDADPEKIELSQILEMIDPELLEYQKPREILMTAGGN